MARTVILSVNDGDWNVWGERFVKRQPLQRIQQLIAPAASPTAAKDAIIRAAQTAGSQGVLIISIGHGTAPNAAQDEGTFQLAPNGSMTIAGGLVPSRFVDVFYDTRKRPDQPSDYEHDLKENPDSKYLKNWKVYQELSAAIKKVGLHKVVLLTCNVGNMTDFMRKVANDWGVVLQGYRRRVGLMQMVGIGSLAGTVPIRIVYIEGFAATPASSADLIVTQEEQIPFDPNLTFLVGPPL